MLLSRSAFLAGYMSKAGADGDFTMWGVKHLVGQNSQPILPSDLDTMKANYKSAQVKPGITMQPPRKTSVEIKPPVPPPVAPIKYNTAAENILNHNAALEHELASK